MRYDGISRQTFYKWLRRYEEQGREVLRDRSSRPHHSTGAADDMRLHGMRQALEGIEEGSTPPNRIDFESYPDPDEEYAAALEDRRTRGYVGPLFRGGGTAREEIAARESLTHVSDVEPARPGDRGKILDRPARELARIAEEQHRTMENYRELDRQLDAAQQVIDDIARRAGDELNYAAAGVSSAASRQRQFAEFRQVQPSTHPHFCARAQAR